MLSNIDDDAIRPRVFYTTPHKINFQIFSIFILTFFMLSGILDVLGGQGKALPIES